MPTRERRSGSQQETRERATDENAENSLSKLITRKETDNGRKHNKDKKGSTSVKGQQKETAEERQLKTGSVLNTHPVSGMSTRPYQRDDREL
jgi:hypothetical protein